MRRGNPENKTGLLQPIGLAMTMIKMPTFFAGMTKMDPAPSRGMTRRYLYSPFFLAIIVPRWHRGKF